MILLNNFGDFHIRKGLIGHKIHLHVNNDKIMDLIRRVPSALNGCQPRGYQLLSNWGIGEDRMVIASVVKYMFVLDYTSKT